MNDISNGKPVTLLRMHAAMIMGIVDPVPMPSPMSDEEFQQIRDHVWPQRMRDVDDAYPHGFYRWCYCQHGTCWNCHAGRCDLCVHRQKRGPDICDGGTVTDTHGYVVAHIVYAPHQRPCRWVCRCPCPKTGPAPSQQPEPAPALPQPHADNAPTVSDESTPTLF